MSVEQARLGTGTNDNIVLADVTGADVSGTKPVPNQNGVVIENGAMGNQVGQPGKSVNLISGNIGDGVLIQTADVTIWSGQPSRLAG